MFFSVGYQWLIPFYSMNVSQFVYPVVNGPLCCLIFGFYELNSYEWLGTSLCTDTNFSFLFSKYIGAGLLGHMINLCLCFVLFCFVFKLPTAL